MIILHNVHIYLLLAFVTKIPLNLSYKSTIWPSQINAQTTTILHPQNLPNPPHHTSNMLVKIRIRCVCRFVNHIISTVLFVCKKVTKTKQTTLPRRPPKSRGLSLRPGQREIGGRSEAAHPLGGRCDLGFEKIKNIVFRISQESFVFYLFSFSNPCPQPPPPSSPQTSACGVSSLMKGRSRRIWIDGFQWWSQIFWVLNIFHKIFTRQQRRWHMLSKVGKGFESFEEQLVSDETQTDWTLSHLTNSLCKERQTKVIQNRFLIQIHWWVLSDWFVWIYCDIRFSSTAMELWVVVSPIKSELWTILDMIIIVRRSYNLPDLIHSQQFQIPTVHPYYSHHPSNSTIFCTPQNHQILIDNLF